MQETELARIEDALGIRLPKSYRVVMLSYPFGNSWPSQAEIPDSVQFVLDLNQELREDVSAGWCHAYFAFGTTPAGEVVAIDVSEDDSSVFMYERIEGRSTVVAPSLREWVEQRIERYVRFDRASAQGKYDEVTRAIERAGFHASPVEPMDGWDRIVLASRRCEDTKSLTGNSFWVSRHTQGWYLGTWGGSVYRISEPYDVAECCVSWLRRGHRTFADFDDSLREEFSLILTDF